MALANNLGSFVGEAIDFLKDAADAAYSSNSANGRYPLNVRVTLDSGHCADISGRLSCARRRH